MKKHHPSRDFVVGGGGKEFLRQTGEGKRNKWIKGDYIQIQHNPENYSVADRFCGMLISRDRISMEQPKMIPSTPSQNTA